MNVAQGTLNRYRPVCTAAVAAMLGLICLVSSPSQVEANDTVAYVRAGGLEFSTTDAVVMEKEDLFISPGKVKVDYVFRNVTNQPVTLRVAFPLPRLDMVEALNACSPMSVPRTDSPNYLDFETRVDGRAVSTQMEAKAFLRGLEITSVLAAAGLPFAIPGDALIKAIENLGEADKKRLKELEAIDEACTDGQLWPRWETQTTYHWEQRFDPGRPHRISHNYTPSIGGFPLQVTETFSPDATVSWSGNKFSSFCMDEPTWNAARKAAVGSRDGYVWGTELDYILQTARSWRGPIREFTLTVDKGKPDAVVSLCATGLRKISPTQFQMKRRDFKPDRDLSVLFISK